MNKLLGSLLLTSACIFGGTRVQAQSPFTHVEPIFQKKFGGSRFDEARKVVALPDGSFIMAGRTSAGSMGNTDLHVMRLTATGDLKWEKKFGGDGTENIDHLLLLTDGSFLITGSSDSDREPEMKDIWLLKLDKEGTEIWQKTYGDEYSLEGGAAAVESHEGGFLVSFTILPMLPSGETQPEQVGLLAVDANGNELWQKQYGGQSSEQATGLVKTDDGYTLLANTESFGKGKWDGWLLHVDKAGEKLWDTAVGGGDIEMMNDMVLLDDGSIIATGYSYSFAVGSLDAWATRIDKTGKQMWQKAYGDVSTDEAMSIIKTADNEFVLVGYTEVWQGNEEGMNISTEGIDVLLVKINDMGEPTWMKSFGGRFEQRGFGVAETADNGLLVVGYINGDSEPGGDMLVTKVGM